jgi:hypothetical protein
VPRAFEKTVRKDRFWGNGVVAVSATGSKYGLITPSGGDLLSSWLLQRGFAKLSGLRRNGWQHVSSVSLALSGSAHGFNRVGILLETKSHTCWNQKTSRSKGYLHSHFQVSSLHFNDIRIGVPILGAVPQLPANNIYLKLYEWSKEYGPIYQVNLVGTNYVWLSSHKVADDLLAKRSIIYSGRPRMATREDNRTSMHYVPLMAYNGMNHSHNSLPMLSENST